MSAADVFDVPARERITNVSSIQPYVRGWFPPRPAMTPEQVEAEARSFRAQQHQILLWRIADKETNMKNRLERRRAAIRGRWIERAKAAFVVLGMMVAIPLAGTVIALSWNALWTVTL